MPLFLQLEMYIGINIVLFPFTLPPVPFANHHLKVSMSCRLLLCQHQHNGLVCPSGEQMFAKTWQKPMTPACKSPSNFFLSHIFDIFFVGRFR